MEDLKDSTLTPASPYENSHSPTCFVDEYDEIDDFNNVNHDEDHHHEPPPVITAFSFSPKIQKPCVIFDPNPICDKKEDQARVTVATKLNDPVESSDALIHNNNNNINTHQETPTMIVTENDHSQHANVNHVDNESFSSHDALNQKLKYHDFLIVELGEDYGFMKMALPRERYEPVYENVRTGKIHVLGRFTC